MSVRKTAWYLIVLLLVWEATQIVVGVAVGIYIALMVMGVLR